MVSGADLAPSATRCIGSSVPPVQREIIEHVVGAATAFVLQCDRWRKSLCYQVRPGASGPRLCVALISLDEGQVDALCANGVAAPSYTRRWRKRGARTAWRASTRANLTCLTSAPDG